MKETNEKRELFEKALIDARLRKAEQITEADREEVNLSNEHQQKMRFILQSAIRKRKSNVKRLSITLLAAAMTAVAAIAIFVNRSHITRFTDEHIMVLFRDDNADKADKGKITEPTQVLEEIYTLSYVPDGFEVVSSSSNATSASTHWQKNTTQSYIIFTQALMDNPVFEYDENVGQHDEINLGNVKIQCIYLDTSSIFNWSYKGYSYSIECSNDLPFDEISKMIITFLRDNC